MQQSINIYTPFFLKFFKLRSLNITFTLLLGVLALSACTPDNVIKSSVKDYEAASQSVDTYSKSLISVQSPEQASPVVHIRNKPWLGLSAKALPKGKELPENFLVANALTLPFESPLSVLEVSNRISLATGIEIRLGSDAPATSTAASNALFFPLSNVATIDTNELVWSGPLDSFLDKWTAHYGYIWDYDGEKISIERFRASLFTINALAGKDTFATSQSSTTASENSSSLSGQSLTFSHTIDAFEKLNEQIKALAGQDTTITISPTSASVAVRGTPFDVERVKNYLDYITNSTLRSTSFAVNIIDIEHTKTADYDLDFDLLFQDVLGKQGLQFVTGGSSSVIGTIRPNNAATTGSTVNATLRALESVSHVTRNFQRSISTLNNQPVSLNERGTRNYISSVSVTTDNGTATSSATQDTIDTGISISIYPLIVDSDKVRVRLNIGIDELVQLREVTTGGNTLQLPETTSDSFRLERVLQSGDTLVLSGATDNRSTSSKTGQGHADNIFFGGSRDGNVTARKQIILLTAIVDPPVVVSEYRERIL